MNIKLKSFHDLTRLATKLLLAGCLATAAHGAAVFTPTGYLSTGCAKHTATLLAIGKVLVAGGVTGSGYTTLAVAELFDPATGVWSPTASLATSRFGHTATLLPNGKVLVAGGYDDNDNDLASAELYDPATGVWSPTGSLGDARHYHTAALLANGKVLIAGGLDDNTGVTASAEVYDPATGAWTSTGSLMDVRVYHTATLLASGQVLVAGGEDSDGDLLASELRWIRPHGTWSPTGQPRHPARRSHRHPAAHRASVLVAGRRRRYLSGALLASAGSCMIRPLVLRSPTGSLGTARESYTATPLAGGQVLVAGGFGGFEDPSGYLSGAEL